MDAFAALRAGAAAAAKPSKGAGAPSTSASSGTKPSKTSKPKPKRVQDDDEDYGDEDNGTDEEVEVVESDPAFEAYAKGKIGDLGMGTKKKKDKSGDVDGDDDLGGARDREAWEGQPWVEKYRPKTMDDISAQEHTIKVLKKTLQSANLPHMLFYGPPGTGKTSTILALCREMFGPLFRTRVLELNASDERGINIVREKVKNFAKAAVTERTSKDAPPYKIIILDEADSMTQDAQSALRRIMETYSKITRFCLICNYVTRIIEPITSRCSKFRFKPLSSSSSLTRLQHICEREGIKHNPTALPALVEVSAGDLRKAITFLQSASRLHAGDGDEIDEESVMEIAGTVPKRVMRKLIQGLGVQMVEDEDDKDGDVEMEDAKGKSKSRVGTKPGSFLAVRKEVETIIREGYSANQIVLQLHDHLILSPLLPSRTKAGIAITLGETDKCLTDGADEELQILNCCLRIAAEVKKEEKLVS